MIDTEAIMSVLKEVAEHEGMRYTAAGVAKGGAIVGGCAAVGGLLGGPIGLSAGGLVGSVYTFMTQRGKYKSVPYIIKYDMTAAQKRRLARKIENIMAQLEVTDIAMLLAAISTNSSIKSYVLSTVAKFFTNEMGYKLVNA